MSFIDFAVPVQVAIITASIGAVTIILNTIIGKLNLTSLKQRRYIDTISKERIEWLNSIRDSFVDFSMLTTELAIEIEIKDITTKDDKVTDKFLEKLVKMQATRKKIKLLLNPSELFVKELDKVMGQLVDLLKSGLKGYPDFDREFHKINEKMYYIQQVILKAEWKRIIIEIEKGKKLKNKEVDEIFYDIAMTIDKDKFGEINSYNP